MLKTIDTSLFFKSFSAGLQSPYNQLLHSFFQSAKTYSPIEVKMNSVKVQIVAVVASLVLLPYCRAADFTVGDSNQWATSVDYTSWVSDKKFAVGDKLVFLYSANHNVLEVSKSAYDSCNTGSPMKSESGGMTTVTLDKTGGNWFICGTPGHCAQGMKLAVTVSAAATTPANPTSPGAATSTPPPPPPSSVAGALYVQMMDVLLVMASVLCIVVVWLV